MGDASRQLICDRWPRVPVVTLGGDLALIVMAEVVVIRRTTWLSPSR